MQNEEVTSLSAFHQLQQHLMYASKTRPEGLVDNVEYAPFLFTHSQGTIVQINPLLVWLGTGLMVKMVKLNSELLSSPKRY